MGNALETILNHVSIRKYQNREIPNEILDKILEAGTRASTTGNMQLYSIIVNKDQKVKEDLAPFHFNQPMVKQAPVLLTFCADINRFSSWCKLRNAEPTYDNNLWFINATIDALLVAQNTCIAAESYGLGICYLGTTLYNADKLIEYYNLPKGVIPITTITIGYPEEIPSLTDRLPVNSVVHYEKYNNYSDNNINEIYKHKEALELTKKLIIENNTQNLAQIFTDKRYKKEDNILFSQKLSNIIENNWKL